MNAPRPPRPAILPVPIVARFLRDVPFVACRVDGATILLLPCDSRGRLAEGARS